MFKIMCDTVVNEDVQNIINVDSVDWKQFHGKTIAVTGATGLIGKMCVFALLAADKKYNLNLKVLAFVRNEKKAKAIFAGEANDQLAFVVTDILEPVPQNIIADYLIHGASVTAKDDGGTAGRDHYDCNTGNTEYVTICRALQNGKYGISFIHGSIRDNAQRTGGSERN